MSTARTSEEWAAYRAEREARYPANRARLPQDAIRWAASKYGRNEYTATMSPEVLATFTDADLIDLADGGPGAHFGGHVERDAEAGTAHITVYID